MITPIDQLVNLVSSFTKLPLRMSRSLAVKLINMEESDFVRIMSHIRKEKLSIERCSSCNCLKKVNLTCANCENINKEMISLFLVMNDMDFYTISQIGGSVVEGAYFNLNSDFISPVNGVFATDLPIEKLLEYIKKINPQEIVFAFDQNLDAEATILYISRSVVDRFPGNKYKFFRLARGIPMGADIGVMEKEVVIEAIRLRQQIHFFNLS